MFETLYTNILAKLAETLPDHTELPFAIEIERNKQGKTEKGYAVTIEDAPSNGDLVGRTTLNLQIQVKLSDKWKPDRNGDSAQQAASLAVADRCLTTYEALALSKLGNSSGVRLVTLENISAPTYLDDEKTVYRVITITANIKV